MFSIVLAQLQNNYFLVHLPVIDSAPVVFSEGRSSDMIQPISFELQSQGLQYLEFVTKIQLLSVSVTKMLGDYSGNIKMPNVN